MLNNGKVHLSLKSKSILVKVYNTHSSSFIYKKKSTNHNFKWLDVLLSPLQSSRFMFILQKPQKTMLANTDIAILCWLSIFFHFKCTLIYGINYYLESMITVSIWGKKIHFIFQNKKITAYRFKTTLR